MTPKLKKTLISNIPYLFVALLASKLGLAWRLAEGADTSEKMLDLFSTLATAFCTLMPSFHPVDLLIGLLVAAAFRLAVYAKSKNAKRFRKNEEYGSARWSA